MRSGFPSRRDVAAMLGAGALTGCGAGASSYEEATRVLRRPLDASASDPLLELVRFATLAANGHNTQPWRFERSSAGIDILPDETRRTPAVDPDDHHLFASLGAAAENLLISAPTLGRMGAFSFDAAAQRIAIALSTTAPTEDALSEAVPRRQCTRSPYDGRSVSREDLSKLEAAARMDGVQLRLLTARADIDQVRDFVVEGNRVQMADPAFVSELKAWLRFNADAALAHGDGLYSACSGNPTSPTWLGAMLFDMVFTEASETERYIAQMDSSAGVAVFTADAADPAHWVQAGRAYQRFALQATRLGIKHAFVNQPVEVPAVRTQLATYLGLGEQRSDLVVRFGYAADLPFSMRRPVEQVLSG